MSDMTIEQLQSENDSLKTEIEKLRNKNTELLAEKKKASGVSSEAQERIDSLESEKAELEARIHHHEVERPRLNLLEVLTPNEHLAGAAMREILHHFDVGHSGEITYKDGTPVTIEKKDKFGDMVYHPLAFDEDGIQALYENGILPALGSMLSGSQASGGGAPGSAGSSLPAKSADTPEPQKEPENSPSFGMR